MSTAVSPTSQTTTWQLDPAHSLVELSVRHMMFTTVKGRFTGFKGRIVDVADNPSASSVEAEIDATTIATGDEKRDAHLRSPDFLDVDKYPTITFKSTRIEGSPERFKLTGNLTLHGVTRELTLDATLNGRGTNPYGKQVSGFSAEGRISRKEFGLNWNVALETGGVLVSDEIKLQIEVQAVKEEAS